MLPASQLSGESASKSDSKANTGTARGFASPTLDSIPVQNVEAMSPKVEMNVGVENLKQKRQVRNGEIGTKE
jgi:hypothetical protein